MSTTITPNMGLVVPGVSTEPGPEWAQEINADLGVLDQHNHTPGQGVQITPAGININVDLPFNSNNATLLKTANFINQGSTLTGMAPNLGCVYVAGGELIYNDEAGNVVPITNNGSVNAGAGSITGLPSGTASASYSAGTFIWQSATNTPATMDMGSVIIRNTTASAHGVTVQPVSALSSNYSLTLPTVPGATSFVQLDSSGNLTATIPVTSIMPSGSMVQFAGDSAPTGFLICDGSQVSRSTFSTLYSVISTNFGSGDGSTTFNLPDMRGQFARGLLDFDAYIFASTAVNTGSNTITIAANAFNHSGIPVQFSVTGGSTLPSPLVASTTYWVVWIDANTIQIASTLDNAMADTADITLTTQGSGSSITITQWQDPDILSRTSSAPGGLAAGNVGSLEQDQFASHTHPVQTFADFNGTQIGAGQSPNIGVTPPTFPAGGNETRSKNIYLNFIIKT